MTTALYRLASNEVLKISLKGQSFAERNTARFGVLTDPALPDGTLVRSSANGTLGPLRQLGLAKIAVPGSNTVRNATQVEIDAFAAAEVDDENSLDAEAAIALLETHPQFRKMMVAFADITKDEINTLRAWITDFKADVAAATTLADLKTRVAANPDLPARTLAQLRTALRNRVNKND
jgi:hypothetical protein